MLPKGRKNVGESLEAAAVRETLEESGYKCTLINHHLPTKALNMDDSLHAEPIAVQQRMSEGIRKIIFWYAAQVDSSSQPMSGMQEEGEDFEVRWADAKDAACQLSFADDRRIVEKALEALQSVRSAALPLLTSATTAG